jgi:hypothetical protein
MTARMTATIGTPTTGASDGGIEGSMRARRATRPGIPEFRRGRRTDRSQRARSPRCERAGSADEPADAGHRRLAVLGDGLSLGAIGGRLVEVSGRFRRDQSQCERRRNSRPSQVRRDGKPSARTNGTWGAFTDLVYLHFGGGKGGSRDFTIGNIGLPADASANFDWSLKGFVWTTAGEYRVVSDPSWTLDVLGGVRWLDIHETLSWDISGSIGNLDPRARSGSAKVTQSVLDAVVGFKGRFGFGPNREWFVPYYFDIGAGQSQSTVQAAAGLGYAFKWGRDLGDVPLPRLPHEGRQGSGRHQFLRPLARRDLALVERRWRRHSAGAN